MQKHTTTILLQISSKPPAEKLKAVRLLCHTKIPACLILASSSPYANYCTHFFSCSVACVCVCTIFSLCFCCLSLVKHSLKPHHTLKQTQSIQFTRSYDSMKNRVDVWCVFACIPITNVNHAKPKWWNYENWCSTISQFPCFHSSIVRPSVSCVYVVRASQSSCPYLSLSLWMNVSYWTYTHTQFDIIIFGGEFLLLNTSYTWPFGQRYFKICDIRKWTF